MTTKTLKLNRSQRMVVFASDDNLSRRAYGCVHIHSGIIEASDSYILVQKYVDYDGKSIVVDARKLWQCSGYGKHGDVYLEEQGDKLVVHGTDTVAIDIESVQFPNMSVLFPTSEEKPLLRITLDRNLLMRLLLCFTTSENLVSFSFYDENKPIIVDVAGAGRGIIMPIETQEV